MIRRLSMIIISILVLISCSTVGSLMQPDWTFSPPKVSGYAIYVSRGDGLTESSARDRAYQEILIKLGNDLGYDVGSQNLREFLSTGAISGLSTSITDAYVYEQSNGEWHYYAMARTPESVLLSSRSPSYIDLLERESKIENKLSEAISCYSDNRDVDAINKVLEAIAISLEGDVNNPDYTPDSLMDKAIGYIDNLKLYLSKQARDSIGVNVKLKRTKGLLYPPVANAIVAARYNMMDVNGNTISTTMRAMTDNSGAFRYQNTNPYTLRDGVIEFSIMLDSSILSEIERKADKGFLDYLYEVLDSKSVAYSYHDKGTYSPKELVLAIALYDEGGNPVDSTSFASALKEYLSNAKAEEYECVDVYGDDFEDIYYDLEKKYPEYRYFAVMRAGLTDYKEYQEDIYARVESRVTIYDSRTMEEIAVQDSNAIGVGASLESAMDNAFIKEARIIAGHLLEEI